MPVELPAEQLFQPIDCDIVIYLLLHVLDADRPQFFVLFLFHVEDRFEVDVPGKYL